MNPGLVGTNFDVAALVSVVRALAQRDAVWRAVSCHKGSKILAQGEASHSVFVLESGLVKLIYETPGGEEWIKNFIVDCGIFASTWPVSADRTSRFAARCLEDSRIATLPATWVESKIVGDPELQAAVVEFNNWVLRRKQAREEALLCDTAEQRYRSFLVGEAALVKRLSQADIARYVGVTPVAFSRIKKRVGRGMQDGATR